jgi:hypothetical protein
LKEAHDELEKELKEVGIISGKTKDTTKKEKNPTREYEKAGGDKELEEDFDKLPGIRIKPPDGIEYKVISNDSKAIKRLRDGDKPPTLEIQPLKDSTKYYYKLRVKVRYR